MRVPADRAAVPSRHELHVRVRRGPLDVDVRLTLEPGAVSVVFGPSGAGKSTLLRSIAGLEPVGSDARVALGAQVWSGDGRYVPTRARRVGLVAQSPALFPHLDVAGNVAYGLPRRERIRSRSEAAGGSDAVGRALRLVGAEHLRSRRVSALSGGEMQRVALARALAPNPQLLLLDEPMSGLDDAARGDLGADLARHLNEVTAPTLMVSHDRSEVLSLADIVVVLLRGRVRQVGTPETVFARPVDNEVARAVGVENVIPGEVVDVRSAQRAGVAIIHVEVPGMTGRVVGLGDPSLRRGERVVVCIRSEALEVATAAGGPGTSASAAADREGGANIFHGRVMSSTWGPMARLDFATGSGVNLTAAVPPSRWPAGGIHRGDSVSASTPPTGVHVARHT